MSTNAATDHCCEQLANYTRNLRDLAGPEFLAERGLKPTDILNIAVTLSASFLLTTLAVLEVVVHRQSRTLGLGCWSEQQL
jgi:hypothetical protein